MLHGNWELAEVSIQNIGRVSDELSFVEEFKKQFFELGIKDLVRPLIEIEQEAQGPGAQLTSRQT
jgi:hypothetical protein